MTMTETYQSTFVGVQSWQEKASCRGQGGRQDRIFFPKQGGSLNEAKAICNVCPVRVACLEHALRNNEEYGIWGGCSERERRRIKRNRRMEGRV